MFCPNCGAKTSIEQKFCRACGLGLEKIALSLTEQLPTRPDENLLSQKERLERIGLALLSVFGLGVLFLILYGIVYKLMITQGKFLTALVSLGLLIMAGCGLLSTILFAKAKEAGEAAGKRRIETKDAAVFATPTKELLTEGNFEPVPSVTDRTTELLYAEKKDAQDH
jgi:zinc ribbon protein